MSKVPSYHFNFDGNYEPPAGRDMDAAYDDLMFRAEFATYDNGEPGVAVRAYRKERATAKQDVYRCCDAGMEDVVKRVRRDAVRNQLQPTVRTALQDLLHRGDRLKTRLRYQMNLNEGLRGAVTRVLK